MSKLYLKKRLTARLGKTAGVLDPFKTFAKNLTGSGVRQAEAALASAEKTLNEGGRAELNRLARVTHPEQLAKNPKYQRLAKAVEVETQKFRSGMATSPGTTTADAQLAAERRLKSWQDKQVQREKDIHAKRVEAQRDSALKGYGSAYRGLEAAKKSRDVTRLATAGVGGAGLGGLAGYMTAKKKPASKKD